jgi:hypothetical protein
MNSLLVQVPVPGRPWMSSRSEGEKGQSVICSLINSLFGAETRRVWAGQGGGGGKLTAFRRSLLAACSIEPNRDPHSRAESHESPPQPPHLYPPQGSYQRF